MLTSLSVLHVQLMTNAGHVIGQNTWDLFTASPTWRAGNSPARCSMGCGAVGRLAIDDSTAFLHNPACAQAKIDLCISLLFSFSWSGHSLHKQNAKLLHSVVVFCFLEELCFWKRHLCCILKETYSLALHTHRPPQTPCLSIISQIQFFPPKHLSELTAQSELPTWALTNAGQITYLG